MLHGSFIFVHGSVLFVLFVVHLLFNVLSILPFCYVGEGRRGTADVTVHRRSGIFLRYGFSPFFVHASRTFLYIFFLYLDLVTPRTSALFDITEQYI